MKEIPLTQGKVALVDDEDFGLLNKRKWFFEPQKKSDTGYAVRSKRLSTGKRVWERMHRLLLGLDLEDKKKVDHINGNGLDNRKKNLRTCTKMQNAHNQKKRSNNTSGYKGVTKHSGKWRAAIGFKMRYYHIGLYDTPEQAAKAYDKKAKELYGDFVRPNFPLTN